MIKRGSCIHDAPEYVRRAFNNDIEIYNRFINDLQINFQPILCTKYKGYQTLREAEHMAYQTWQHFLNFGEVVGQLPKYDILFDNGTIHFNWKENKQ